MFTGFYCKHWIYLPVQAIDHFAYYWCSFLSNGHERDQSKDSCLYGRHAKGIIHDIRMTKITRDLVWGLRLWQAEQAPVWVKINSQKLSSQSQVGAQLCQVKSWLMTWLEWLDSVSHFLSPRNGSRRLLWVASGCNHQLTCSSIMCHM